MNATMPKMYDYVTILHMVTTHLEKWTLKGPFAPKHQKRRSVR